MIFGWNTKRAGAIEYRLCLDEWKSTLQTKTDVSEIVLPHVRWKPEPGQVLAMPMLTALQPSSFREAVRNTAKWEGVETDPDKILQKIGNPMVAGAP